jgi:stage V sporulation protein B
MWPIWLYQAFLNALMQIDLQVLKRTVTELASNGRSLEAAREIANAVSGDYKAAQAFAFVPYQLILSVTFIVFPMVSKATSSGDEEGRRRYVRNAMRFSLLVLLSIATPIAGAADGVMRIAFPAAFISGASALQMLVMGMVPFSLFVITATVLSSAGRPWVAAMIAGGASVMAIALDRTLILAMGVEHATFATALGTSISTTTAMVVVGAIVRISYGAWIPPLSALRGLIAGGVGFVVAYYVPHQSRLTAILALAVGFFAYLAALAITGEIGKEEIASVQKIISRRKR